MSVSFEQEVCPDCGSDDTETYKNNDNIETGYYCYKCGYYWNLEESEEEN